VFHNLTRGDSIAACCTPQAGDEFHVVESEARAREIADFRGRRDRQAQLAKMAGGRGTLEEMMKGIREGTAKDLPVLIKADVQGSAEALAGAISQLSTEKVTARVVYSGVGGISEADITLAKASNALLIGFNVRANPQAREIAKRDKVDIRYYSIIYKVTEDIQALMLGLVDPTFKESFLGLASGHTTVDRANAVRVLEALAAGATDLGSEGIDTTYGRGLVGASLKPGWE
jgi:translation initiation factor IF-2